MANSWAIESSFVCSAHAGWKAGAAARAGSMPPGFPGPLLPGKKPRRLHLAPDELGSVLLAQQPHATFKSIDGQREHAVVHDLPDHGDRLPVLPQAFRLGVEPDEFREHVGEALQPL